MAFMDDYASSVSGGAASVAGPLPAVATKAGSALGGIAAGVGGLFTGGLLPLATSILGSVMGGPDTPAGPSGGGIFTAGGINVGSKVVGSGSAATSFPSPASPGAQGGFYTDNSATAGAALPKWVIPAAIGAGLLIVVLMFFSSRRAGNGAAGSRK